MLHDIRDDEDFFEVAWDNDRNAGLESCQDLDVNSNDAQPLVEELWAVSAIQQELNRLSEPESYPIVTQLAYLASKCLCREQRT